MTTALSALRGALVLFAAAAVGNAGALTVTQAYQYAAVAQMSVSDLNALFNSVDNVISTNVTKFVSLPAGSFNVNFDLSKVKTSEFNTMLYGRRLLTEGIAAYYKETEKFINATITPTSDIADKTWIPLGQCYMPKDGIGTGQPEGITSFSYSRNGVSYSLKAEGANYGSAGGPSDSVFQWYNQQRLKCIKPATINEYALKNQLDNTSKAAIMREILNGVIAQKLPAYLPVQPVVTIGPDFSYGVAGSECTQALCGTFTPPATGDTTGGTAPTPTTSAACTKPDGVTSGNPYDCAPSDSETSCKIIDLICAGKKLFIPRKSFLEDKLKDGIGFNVNFPVTVADKWDFNIKLAGVTIPVGARFDTLNWNEETKDLWRFYVWWGNFLFLLAFIGVPFMSRKAVADSARDATEGAALRQAEADLQAEQDYRKLRDTPWDKF